MYYPINLSESRIFPLFGNYLQGPPQVFDFSSNNPKTLEYDPSDFNKFNEMIFGEMQETGKQWGIGKYLEERRQLLRFYPNLVKEKRFYHLGLDIIVPYDTPMYAPLEGEVYAVGKETQIGNYGGYLMLKHRVQEVTFYSFYGHLKTPHLFEVGTKIKAGQEFARVGEKSDSGGWFCHTHLQILTQAAVEEGLTDWGYAGLDFLPSVEQYFPSPYFLFKQK